jgi:hypothetical protein
MSIIVIEWMTTSIPQIPGRFQASRYIVLCTGKVFGQAAETVGTSTYSKCLCLGHAAATAADASGIAVGVVAETAGRSEIKSSESARFS